MTSPALTLDSLTIVLRIGSALAVGAILGVNRDLHHKPAGVRTHSLVSIGSALVVMLAFAVDSRNGDAPSRVMQGLVTGIGFLGAGVILHRDKERRIEGLTTAASIWVAAGFGMACGAGLFNLAAIALGATMLALVLGGPFERALERRFMRKQQDQGTAGPPVDPPTVS